MTDDAPLKPRIRSYSQLTSYFECAYKYKLLKIDRLPEPPSVYLLGGTAFHAATEDFDRKWFWAEQDSGTSQLVQFDPKNLASERNWLRDVFLDTFYSETAAALEKEPDYGKWRVAQVGKLKSLPEGEDLAWWKENGQEMVAAYVDFRMQTDDRLTVASVSGQPAVEVEVRARIYDDVELLGYVDRVFVDRTTGVRLVVDLKTGKNAPKSNAQLGLYSVLLDQLGLTTTYGSYYKARAGALGEVVDLTSVTFDKELRKFRYLEDQIQAGNFPANPSALCKFCTMAPHCEFKAKE